MFWTHVYDLIVKIGVLFLSIFIVHNITFLEDKGIVVVVTALVFSIFAYIIFLRTLGSYLCCKLNLKMNVDFKQAKALNEALSPNPFPFTNLQWLPLKEVKALKNEQKFEAAITLLNNWKKEKVIQQQEKNEQSKNSSATVKRLEILSAIIVIASFTTSFMKLPPATFLIKYYCEFFDTDKYSPFIIGCIMTTICLVPIMLIKKNLEDKST